MSTTKKLSTEMRSQLEALIAQAQQEISATVEIDALAECRALIKQRVPLMRRSWVFAALLLSMTKGDGRRRDRNQGRNERQERPNRPERTERGEKPARSDQPRKAEPAPKQDKSKAERSGAPRAADAAKHSDTARPAEKKPESPFVQRENRYKGEAVTVFVSAGRRQRFYARIALKLLAEVCGIQEESVGDIRTMDNYSFINLDPAVADTVVASLNGSDFKGRALTVNLARKRDELGGRPDFPQTELEAEDGGEDTLELTDDDNDTDADMVSDSAQETEEGLD